MQKGRQDLRRQCLPHVLPAHHSSQNGFAANQMFS